MQLLRLRRMPVWLAGPVSVLLVLGVSLPSHAQGIQASRLPKALDYPDGKTVALRYARVVVEVNISGTHTERDATRVLTESLTLKAQVSYVEQPQVRVTARHVDGKNVTTEVSRETKSVITLTFALSDTRSTPLGAKRTGMFLNVPVRKRYGATHFGVWAAHDSPWGDIPGRLVTKTSDSSGEQTSEDKATCTLLARVPYHSTVGATPFTALALSLEAAGKDGDNPLIGGIIEALWDKGGSFGSFSVPVLASNALGYVVINTKAAWNASGETGPLFPGWLRVTWVLDTKAPAGR